MRNPDDKSDKQPYRKCYLQKGTHEGHTEMVAAGKAAFGDKFHMSYTYFSDLRPFYVKDETRDTCVCVYHMRWHEFADGSSITAIICAQRASPSAAASAGRIFLN